MQSLWQIQVQGNNRLSPRGRFLSIYIYSIKKSGERVTVAKNCTSLAEQVALSAVRQTSAGEFASDERGCWEESLEGARSERHLPIPLFREDILTANEQRASHPFAQRIYSMALCEREERRGANKISLFAPRLVVAKDVSAIAIAHSRSSRQYNEMCWRIF